MDVIIVGTGVSALLLAEALVHEGAGGRLRIIGPHRPLRARLLSYWSDEPTPFDAFAVASWTRIGIAHTEGEQAIPLSRFTYRTMRAEAWAAHTRAVLVNHGVEIIDGTVDRVEDRSRPAVWSGGRRLEADCVFTSQPPAPHDAVWQRFAGWELAVPAGGVDPDVAMLLDFRTDSRATVVGAGEVNDFRFIYRLPLAPHRLFVEHVSYQPCDHQAAVATYVRDVLGLADVRVLAGEAGMTPTFREPPSRGEGRVFRIGVTGGLAKTTTGYALLRMWRDARWIAASVAQHGDVRPREVWPSLYRLSDRYFVDRLHTDPGDLPEILTALFTRASGDAVLGFLDERARFGEQLAVARAVPGWLRTWGADRLRAA